MASENPMGWVGLSRISETSINRQTLVAKYYAENEDIDGDQVPHWSEWREFGTSITTEPTIPTETALRWLKKGNMD